VASGSEHSSLMLMKWYPEFITDIEIRGRSRLEITYNFVRD
jgi:hypothetical protein